MEAALMVSFGLDSAANDPSQNKQPIGAAARPEWLRHMSATLRGDGMGAAVSRMGKLELRYFANKGYHNSDAGLYYIRSRVPALPILLIPDVTL